MPSNNPFAPPPQTEVSQAAHRFPDVLNQDPDLRHHQQQQQQQQVYSQGQGGYGLAPQQTAMMGYAGQYGAASPSPGPQQSQYYGQQLQPQQTGYTQMYSNSGYNQSPYSSVGQPQPQQPYYSDLDPYSSLGSSSFASPSSQSQQQQGSSSGTLLAVQQTTSHPRDYVHENKAQLMVWDEYAWKQLFSRLDALREAWETRLAGLKAASSSGADPTAILSLRREAEDKIDGIHASKMQLDEVKSGWRHSTDVASKARVREALNAGLSSLPPYPAPLNPSQLGGSFIHHAQKETIMAQYTGFGQPQQQQQPQQTGYQQPQMTGYGGGGGGYGMGGGMQQQQQMTGYGSGMGGMGGMGGMQPQMTGYGNGGGMGYGGGAAPGYGGPQQGYY
ncbi:hypothetical protein JCM10908_006338 [Rhodotorula pacifica]|uniref:uncharacterized protein n=1 Tax=Rhodotorula pacifica TaxID=1495444 RepID=UPI00317D494E